MSNRNEIVTHASADYGGKICRCCRCGTEELCSFDFDFYPSKETDKKGRALLLCERCVMMEHFGTAYPKKAVLGPDGILREE